MIRTSVRGSIDYSGMDLLNLPSLPVLNNTVTDQIGMLLTVN
jgi:hypothetical protein